MNKQPIVVAKIGARRWRLERNFKTKYGTVPKGFETDGATVPRIAWSIVSPGTRFFEAAVVHDYLLSCYDDTRGKAKSITLKYCTTAFAETALRYGAKSWVVTPVSLLVHTWTSVRRKWGIK